MRFTPRNAATAGLIGSFYVVALANGVAVVAQDNKGFLRAMTCSRQPDDHLDSHRRATVVVFKAREIKLMTTSLGGSNLAGVVRSENGKLQLIGWASQADGSSLRGVGGSTAGESLNVSADVVSRSFPGLAPRNFIVTGSRGGDAKLHLITWDTNLNNP